VPSWPCGANNGIPTHAKEPHVQPARRPSLLTYGSFTMQRKYTVKTNGLIGTCEYTASDPDDAAVCAMRHENYLRLLSLGDDCPAVQAHEFVMVAGAPPEFRIESIRLAVAESGQPCE
jgi:hypothetical protein